ncbi:Na+/H+ antiporter [Acidipila sp. EB88]|uniref:Na+/H+ antiporter n=1 Tax=Acidipila sp. EB88 TaxID=2305226 RepID=UPI000F5E6C1C|nr:Na+/H+ antiporter [Acidipila sp. EB88]RRA47945.1 Na+/H+ antiporter [Acidipila sp. EB88]
MHEGVRQVELVFLFLLLFVIIFGALAKQLRMAYPIVLVIAGLMVSFIPGLPRISLNPDIVFLAILPPLLYHAAWQTSWREFRYNIVSILLLAFGLVAFTVFGIAFASEKGFSLLYWNTGFVLGAIVAPTDAIAATSIARRVGLPQRIVDILEGESLVNDATGLLALEFGIALVVEGHTPSFAAGATRLVWLIAAGIGIGVLVGWLVRRLELLIDDGPIEMTIGLVTPYAAYIAAEEAHASGVIAVVATGLYIGRHSSVFFSPSVRLQAYALWNAIDFVLNGLVFVLIGLQLPFVLAGLHQYSRPLLLGYAVSFSVLVIALRLLWIYPGAWTAHLIRCRVQKQNDPFPAPRALFVVGWTGMRGVVSLAAALSVPETLANGQPFPGRNLIIFLTFSVILVTLVLQGLTLPPLVRALSLASRQGPDCEEDEARRLMIEAAVAHIEQARNAGPAATEPALTHMYEDLLGHHHQRLTALECRSQAQEQAAGEAEDHEVSAEPSHYLRYRELSQDLLRIERQTALRLRDDGRISDTVLRRLERELDLSETRISTS